MSAAVGLTFLLGALFNVVVPHFDRVAHSVQTRCQIMDVSEDEYINEELFHYTVKFPLPGIDGLRDGEMLCYGSQRCSTFVVSGWQQTSLFVTVACGYPKTHLVLS